MLTVRIQAIDGTGTCTLLDSQPCRLLTSLHALASEQRPSRQSNCTFGTPAATHSFAASRRCENQLTASCPQVLHDRKWHCVAFAYRPRRAVLGSARGAGGGRGLTAQRGFARNTIVADHRFLVSACGKGRVEKPV